jgi:cell division protein FtsZ
MTDEIMDFNFPTDPTKIIKVIGIGGGGVNAVNYMYNSGAIRGVNFAICNTDSQSFIDVNVPVKVTLGEGLGSGGDPQLAKKEFEKSKTEVETLLDDGTKMVFITTGMGGGTGSGAGPLLAKMAKDKEILTVGIVTIPFLFEKVPRIIQALDAVEEMSKNVDSLIVINNERLKTYYPGFDIAEAFKRPNEVLAMAVKSISEIITQKGIINRDFNDVTSTMKNGGVALVSYGFGSGENRLESAILEALNSPLLSNNDIYNAKRVLFYISIRPGIHFLVDELSQHIDVFMKRFDGHIKMIWGFGYDGTLSPEQEVKFIIITTGFGTDDVKYDIDDDTIKKMGENEILKAEEIERIKKKNEKRVKQFYPDFDTTPTPKINRFAQSSIIVLRAEELDDETIIKFMEDHPTYSRTAKEIAEIRKPTKNETQAKISMQETDAKKKQTVITF